MRKQICAVLVLVALVLAVPLPAGAVPPGFTLKFDGNGEGEVVFTGARHTGKGMHCENCHYGIFDTSRSAQITRADHRRKQFCFTCHDGVAAFAARSNCDRCHAEVDPGLDPAAATAAVPPPPASN